MQDRRRQGRAWLALATVAAVAAVAAAPRTPAAFGSPSYDSPLQGTAVPTPDTVVIEGRILYIDRDSDRNHPAAGLKVEIWDRDKNFPVTGEKLD
jgi:hypothetical protein